MHTVARHWKQSLNRIALSSVVARSAPPSHSRSNLLRPLLRMSLQPTTAAATAAVAAPAAAAASTPASMESSAPIAMDTSSSVAAPSSAAVAAASASSPAVAHAHYSCKLIGLSGWEGAAKVERRLLAAGITFLGVAKRKGDRETVAEVYFDSQEQMDAQVAKMTDMRAEVAQQLQPTASASGKRKAESSEPAAAAASAGAASTDADAEVAAVTAAASRPVALGRQLFKVRTPMMSLHPEPYKRAGDAAPGVASFRGGERTEFKERSHNKRAKIEVKEGEVGYVHPDAAAAGSADGGERSDGEGGGRSSSPGPASASGRLSPSHQVEASVNDIVAPLWRKPYAEQLKLKRSEVLVLMRDTTRKWRREYGGSLSLPHEVLADPTGANTRAMLFCPLDPIIGSAVTDAYRNKVELSVGLDSKGELCTGHLMGKYTEGTVRVEGVESVPHVPSIAKALSRCFNAFAQEVAAQDPGLGPYDKRDHSGFWRLLSVRNSAETKQVMVLIQVDPKARSGPQMEHLRAQLLEHFRKEVLDNAAWKAANDGYELRAIQLQQYSGVSNAAPEGTAIELLHGEEACIREKLMGLTFRVSQSAFFQINVPQTEVLYNVAANFAKLPLPSATQAEKDQHLLLDVCCGTGTIGLSLANRVGKVVGLEMSAAATEVSHLASKRANKQCTRGFCFTFHLAHTLFACVCVCVRFQDAKFNAAANGITNAFYYVGKAEDTLSVALADHVTPLSATPALAQVNQAHSVTAILDPPRSGVHADVVRLLRRCPKIQRIVYVSCNPKSMMDNLQRFVRFLRYTKQ